MTAQQAAARGRSAAEKLMVDTCTVTRGGTRALNAGATAYVVTGGATIYTGPCKVQQSPSRAGGEQLAGMREVVQYSSRLDLPLSVTGIQVDDVALIVTSQDPALVGCVLRVTQTMYGTFKTARRLPVEEVTG